MENEEILGKPQIWDTPQCPAPPPPHTNQTPAAAAKKHAKVVSNPLPLPPPPHPPTPPQTPRQGPQGHRPRQHRPEWSFRNRGAAHRGNPNTAPPPSGPREPCADPTRIRPKDKINHTGEFWKTAISKAYEKFKGFSRDLILFWIVASCRAVTL